MSTLYQRALPYISLSLLHLFYSTQAALSWSVKRPGISLFWLLMLHPDIWSRIIVHPWDSGCPLLSLRLFLVSMPSWLPLVHFSVHCGRRAALQKLWTHSFHLVREGSHCPLESIIIIFLLLCINFSNVYPWHHQEALYVCCMWPQDRHFSLLIFKHVYLYVFFMFFCLFSGRLMDSYPVVLPVKTTNTSSRGSTV